MTQPQVLIVGAGPTGLMLGSNLQLTISAFALLIEQKAIRIEHLTPQVPVKARKNWLVNHTGSVKVSQSLAQRTLDRENS